AMSQNHEKKKNEEVGELQKRVNEFMQSMGHNGGMAERQAVLECGPKSRTTDRVEMVNSFMKMSISAIKVYMQMDMRITAEKRKTLDSFERIAKEFEQKEHTEESFNEEVATVMHQMAESMENICGSNPKLVEFREAIAYMTNIVMIEKTEKKAVEQTEKEKKKEMKSVSTTTNNNFGKERVPSKDRPANVNQ
ncbi:hypothetical protein PENTCL1PPCAC_19202, partial [Pristionchus entomophagus]